ncbi:hypothetical protein S4054249_10620 [Pseudoalteromonas luteoviolacea]|uniref:Uncharacterized protein n=2 Tax=Pseudoalteromonas luteoviolacea TaxID=43657 RepID=A0A0F6AFP1_9GAMM|nr:hypothetical protein [Pseudoalteromonas luteoviolacea]KKE84199.1 hypothetical protein N479_09885 [Pseudoalteromonas luteoviolacea S4054]KZN76196.1 hypothetical protein N481_07530 [Pseudoalteromonas luteoviolacea S4047-1]AOT08266.1 hypothetical protein S4054249_10620 [Pseudoalteromonas luteoviolacea]AOT13182.1 hypothetical protein S40542_10595 [Pseudoalteromonas luteoviolacea]AOT18094.1 hypothetical protein S4054_10590 [Pseudoalteromonas luteoviolacea]
MRQNRLKFGARFSLFIVSYLPLFFIMSFTQLYQYKQYLNWGGINLVAISNFFKYFGAVAVIGVVSIVGILGLLMLLKNVKRRCVQGGREAVVQEIENKNSESITYLFTYLIPFVFQDLSSFTNVVSIAVLLIVTFMIYVNSGMILINPTISMRYTLYQVTYKDHESGNSRKGMIITKCNFLEEGDKIEMEDVGHKLFYAQLIEDDNAAT